MRLYDTLTRSVKPLASADGKRFRFYCCGPTVYGPAHIGNFRAFLVQDVLRRTLEVAGLRPYHVRNITDVDDKTIRVSQEQGLSLTDFTQQWTAKFHDDCEALNALPPHVEPRATEHIGLQVGMIKKLVEGGYAYASGDGSVYFKVAAFDRYGHLAHLDREALQTQKANSAGERNDADEYDRETVSDFALWKARKPEDGENFWPSPWGEGRPGWHVECSAMSTRYLGKSFDLHGGGIDLCFPHHENEIAQSECAHGNGPDEPFARHWFHNAHLVVDGRKMSKSLGNLYTLADLEAKGFAPAAVRWLLISGHYRQPLNFTENGLKAAASAIAKLEKGAARLLAVAGLEPSAFASLATVPASANWGNFAGAWEALIDDLGTSSCIGQIFQALEKTADSPESAATDTRALATLLYALGIPLFTGTPKKEAPASIRDLADARWTAKTNRDFARADELRAELQALGWSVLDRKEGYDLEEA